MKITYDILKETATAQLNNKLEPVNMGALSNKLPNEKVEVFANDIYHKDEHIPPNKSSYDRPLSITAAPKSEQELLDKMLNVIDL